LYPEKAISGDYLVSAHGDNSIGVLRTSLSTAPTNYARGNCAHCHEQHASIGGSEPAPNTGDDTGPDIYLLFKILWVSTPQSYEFCFGCHIEIDSYQSIFQRVNYSYSYWKGGDTTLTCPNSIYESFHFVRNNGNSQSNCSELFSPNDNRGSSHMLRDIRNLLSNQWGFPSNNDYVNPCSGCHNPHRAKRDYPTSLPSTHADLLTWNVWGDDTTTERMNTYTPFYWPPCKYSNSQLVLGCESGNEPDGNNLPDYVGLCKDCHNKTRVIYSNRLNRNLYRINWDGDGDFHGTRPKNDGPGDRSFDDEWGDLLEPYKVGSAYQYSNYVLSCTDCHEPHGSPNEFLLRKTANGVQVNVINGEGRWYNWCQTCHLIYWNPPTPPGYSIHPPMNVNSDCFSAGGCHRHCDGSGCTIEGTLM
jgi:cytochrome c553